MSDQDLINQEITNARNEGREIRDGVARAIAAGHASGTGLGQQFATTGFIPDGEDGPTSVWRALAYDYETQDAQGQAELDALGTYLVHRKTRGVKIPYWHALWADTPDDVLSVDDAMACLTRVREQFAEYMTASDSDTPTLRYGHEGAYWSIDWEPGPEEWVFKVDGPDGVLVEPINTVIVGLHRI